jgi:glycosyltransferase involved in cell wall biosynthesis
VNKKQVRQKLGLPLDKKILVFAADYGKRNTWKGGHLLEEIFDGLSRPNDYLLLHIGDEKQAREGNWYHAGHIQEPRQIAEYLAAADLLINPSLADSFSLVTAEAMACGTPVIAFRTGGIPEIVDNAENGIIVPYHNTGAFVAAIQRYFESSDHHEVWQNRARHKIETHFTLDLMLENYAKLYETILSRQNPEFSLHPTKIENFDFDAHQVQLSP